MKLRIKSFRAAFAGIAFMLRTQIHARWHLLATVAVTASGFAFHVGRGDWMALILAISMVWTAEAVNTAIESACDAITMENHPLIGSAKDAAAGAVLLASVFAVIIAVLVFAPKF